MSIKLRVFLILSLVLAIYAVGHVMLIDQMITPPFLEYERRAAEHNLDRCVDAINRELEFLAMTAADWAWRDDTFDYIQDRHTADPLPILTAAILNNLRVDIAYLCNLEGKVIWRMAVDPVSGNEIELEELPVLGISPSHRLLQHETNDSRVSGILPTEHGNLLLVSRPITDSKQARRGGSLILGRFLTKAERARIANQVKVNFTFRLRSELDREEQRQFPRELYRGEPTVQSAADITGGEQLQASRLLADLHGRPLYLVQANYKATISNIIQTVMRVNIIVIALAFAITLLCLMFLLNRAVLSRTRKLTKEVEDITVGKDLSIRVANFGNDELGTLANGINCMLTQLENSENRYRSVFENAAVGLFQAAKESGTVTAANPKMASILGFAKADDLLNRSLVDIGLIPNQLEYNRLCEQLTRGIPLNNSPRQLKDLHGNEIWVGLSAQLSPNGNELIEGDVLNISEQKRAEHALKLTQFAMDCAQDAIYWLCDDGHLIYANREASRLLEYPIEELLNMRIAQIDPRLSGDAFERLWKTLKGCGSMVMQMEHRNRNGESIPVEVAASFIDFEGIEQVCIFARDGREREALESRLRQSEKMEAIGQLAGGVAHDFNNQLAAIMGYAELLVDRLSHDAALQRFAENVLTSAQRSADLTAQLLAFARKGKYQHVKVDIHETILETIDMLTRGIDKRIQVEKDLKAWPATTMGDPTQLQNVFLNLGLNARDAMPEGGTLTFKTAVTSLDENFCKQHEAEIVPGPYLKVTVADTGEGIEPEVQNRMFEPFFTTKEKSKGTGMGLAAVYGTVRYHRGAINVDSAPGRGSAFDIYLPFAEIAASEARLADSPSTVDLHGLRLLLIDDEEMICNLATDMLSSMGCAIHCCHDGQDGIDYYARNWQSVDIVILDVVMPRKSGLETFVELKKINSEVRVLVASGYNISGEAQAILAKGALDFLQKPFRHTELIRKISETIQQ